MIKVGNIRTYAKDGSIAIKIDRSSVLGNPFYMSDESKRDVVCDKYEDYFNEKVEYEIEHGGYFVKELYRILSITKDNDVTLLCWCYPKRCHGETIKRWLEEKLKEMR